jgi:MATE family multidrug resistance protein
MHTPLSPADAPASEWRAWFGLCWPLAITLLSRQLAMFTDLAVLGQWNSDYLGAAGVAAVYTSLTSVVVWRGILEALNMLCSQAFGAKNPALAGEWLKVGVWVGFVASLAVGLTWGMAGTVLQPMADFGDVERDRVNLFCRVLVIGLIPFTGYVAVTNYMSSAGIVMPPLWVNLLAVFLNLGLNWLFVGGPAGLGFPGSALATSVTRIVVFVAIVAWVVWHVNSEPEGAMAKSWPRHWLKYPRASFREFGKQAIPIALSSLLEEAQIQVVGIMAARLGDDEMATHNAMLQIVFVLSSLMWATSSATQVRMSVHLGAGNVAGAKSAMRIGATVATALGSGTSVGFVLFRGDLAGIFTQDARVHELTSQIAVLVGLGYFMLAAFYIAMVRACLIAGALARLAED